MRQVQHLSADCLALCMHVSWFLCMYSVCANFMIRLVLSIRVLVCACNCDITLATRVKPH